MVMPWARAILSISKKAWSFPVRPYYYILSFPKINRNPNNSKAEGRKGHTGPMGQPRGEELPFRFLSRPSGSRGDILGPQSSPMWGRAALQVPLSSHDIVMDWVHPGGSQQTTEDEMVGWHHWLSGHGFGWTLVVGDGQGGLACCSSWGPKSQTRLRDWTWTELNWNLNCIKMYLENVEAVLIFLKIWKHMVMPPG